MKISSLPFARSLATYGAARLCGGDSKSRRGSSARKPRPSTLKYPKVYPQLRGKYLAASANVPNSAPMQPAGLAVHRATATGSHPMMALPSRFDTRYLSPVAARKPTHTTQSLRFGASAQLTFFFRDAFRAGPSAAIPLLTTTTTTTTITPYADQHDAHTPPAFASSAHVFRTWIEYCWRCAPPPPCTTMEKFPELDTSQAFNGVRSPSPYKSPSGYSNGSASLSDRGASAKRENGHHLPAPGLGAWSTHNGLVRGHARQNSLSDAFRTIRTRNGSLSQNAHELADALKAPVSPKLVILCITWYMSSALTNTSSKSILNAFNMPATLTLVQFAFVSTLCITIAWLATIFPILREKITALQHPIRPPTRDVIITTLPLAAFQIIGHLLSSSATSRIPVSLVHTIKGLSPLFTVLAYRFIYNIRYPKATYLSLVPLTLGVMLACSGKHGFGGQLLGVLQAFLAAIVFVTQNIFSKKLFNEAAKVESGVVGTNSKKLDKLNLLCYSSGLAFLLTLPIWFFAEGVTLLRDVLQDGAVELSNKPNAFDHGRLTVEFIFNGVFHFGQNILAFVLLSMVSPVTYSVASLLKRVFVIVLAILWFRSPMSPLQGLGIALTILGLYLYDRTSESNKADRKAQAMTQSRAGTPLLPINEVADRGRNGFVAPSHPISQGYGYFGPSAGDSKRSDD
ncbi:glucose-6-phosphate phosphate translocator 1 [Cordyceps militaris]|uniref:Glucose-6-phosphate phosphate translocator 1 n=1 Tax=Cordyceps militaris TaxID=73501 RepID=A0A2H4SWM0_CORMI|nr:glucose-6-phosphate phosphate translocator 1 [Cordyceps militaris]